MNLAAWIGVGAGCGVAAGLLGGESCQVLKPVGAGYVMLLESVVYPYLISSLLHGLGRLSPLVALKLLKKSWPFYLAAWGGTLGLIYLLSQAFPAAPPPVMVDAGEAARSGPNFLELILPSNIFHDLANNYVPAVVMLSLLFGVAIQGIKGKERVLDILVLIRTACVKIWNWVVYLAPVAVFAMFAVTMGTTQLEKAGGLALYAAIFLTACAILAFFALPMAISSLIPVRYREIFSDLRNALTLSLVTTLSVVALPYIQQAAEKLARANGVDDADHKEIIETSLAVNYPLGQLGNFFVYLFILFMAFYTRTSLSGAEQVSLPFMTLFSCVGSPTSTVNAVDFLGAWLRLPDRPTELYVATMMVTRYGQVALSVMGFAFLTYLMTFNYYGKIKLRLKRIVACCALVLAAVAGLSLGGHVLFSQVLDQPQRTYLNFTLPAELTQGISAKVYQNRAEFLKDYPEPDLKPGESVFERIQRTHTLRVGFGRDITPFGYFNRHGDLVGHDIACAYGLARSLNVKLVFVPVVYDLMEHDVKKGYMDMWAGGVYVTESRMVWGAFSDAIYHSPMALIVPAGRLDFFLDMTNIENLPDFSLAILDTPTLHALATRLFPKAKLEPVTSYEALPDLEGWDAALWTLEQAGVWASGHPGYSAVRPKNMSAVAIIAFLLPKNSEHTVRFLNHWLAMRKADGFMARQREYWMERSVVGGMQYR